MSQEVDHVASSLGSLTLEAPTLAKPAKEIAVMRPVDMTPEVFAEIVKLSGVPMPEQGSQPTPVRAESVLDDPTAAPTPERKVSGMPVGASDDVLFEHCCEFLKHYPFSHQSLEVHFSASLPRTVRRRVHDFAESVGLFSNSIGHKDNRFLTVCNRKLMFTAASDSKSAEIYEHFVDRGYVAFEGPYVNYLGSFQHDAVTADSRKQRENRDGPLHHITVVNVHELEAIGARLIGESLPEHPEPAESPSLQAPVPQRSGTKTSPSASPRPDAEARSLALKKRKEMLNAANNHVFRLLKEWVDQGKVKNDFIPHGVGKATEESTQATAFFRVIEWPALNEFRTQALGLKPADFHITMGFIKSDVHNVCKDRSTLLPPPEAPIDASNSV